MPHDPTRGLRIWVERFVDAMLPGPIRTAPCQPEQQARTAHRLLCPQASQAIVFGVDRSGSMATDDFSPSRLEGAKQGVAATVRRRGELGLPDAVALIAFDEQATTVCPFVEIAQGDVLLKRLAPLSADDGTDIRAGLEEAMRLFRSHAPDPGTPAQLRRLILLTDGHGGEPVGTAHELKTRYQVLIDVIGVGGDPQAVNEGLLRQVATTEASGFVHYWFIRDTGSLIRHYEALATTLIWKGKSGD